MMKSLSRLFALSLAVLTVSACADGHELTALDPAADAASITLVAHNGNGSCGASRPELTADQRDDLRAMRESAHEQVLAILTPEQAAQLEVLKSEESADRGPGRGPGRGRKPHPLEELDLTAEQEAQVETIREATRTEMRAYFDANQIEMPQRGIPEHRLESLDLTPEQEDQLAAIKEDAHAQFLTLLTPEQTELVEATTEAGQPMRNLRGQLNLTEEQKVQLCELRQATKASVESVLTSEQLNELTL